MDITKLVVAFLQICGLTGEFRKFLNSTTGVAIGRGLDVLNKFGADPLSP
jgi:hypothetical protein